MYITHNFINAGGARLHVCRADPAVEPRFVLQLIHGISEHVGRYKDFIEYITYIGGLVIAHDLRGHGHSVPNPIMLGHMEEQYLNYIGDIDAVRSECLTKEEARLPIYLFGFSMGALIAGLYAAHSSEGLAGLILAGLPKREPLISFPILLTDIICLFRGGSYRSESLNHTAFTRFNKGFEPDICPDGEISDEFLWLSNDIGNRMRFISDELCNVTKTAETYGTLMRFVRDMYNPASWNMDRRDLPILILNGGLDPVSGNEKQKADSARFLADMGYTDIRVKAFPSLRHEIFFDTGCEEPLSELFGFIVETLPAEYKRICVKDSEYKPQFS